MENITLKNVKFHEDMSEETPCFSADLYENGKLIAYVSNRGNGGCNNVHPAEGLTYKDVQHLTTLDADCVIMQLAEEYNFATKHQSKNFVLNKGEKFYTQKFPMSISKLKKHPQYNDWLKKQKEKIEKEGYKILNRNL